MEKETVLEVGGLHSLLCQDSLDLHPLSQQTRVSLSLPGSLPLMTSYIVLLRSNIHFLIFAKFRKLQTWGLNIHYCIHVTLPLTMLGMLNVCLIFYSYKKFGNGHFYSVGCSSGMII